MSNAIPANPTTPASTVAVDLTKVTPANPYQPFANIIEAAGGGPSDKDWIKVELGGGIGYQVLVYSTVAPAPVPPVDLTGQIFGSNLNLVGQLQNIAALQAQGVPVPPAGPLQEPLTGADDYAPYTPTQSGTYYIQVEGADGGVFDTGAYRVAVVAPVDDAPTGPGVPPVPIALFQPTPGAIEVLGDVDIGAITLNAGVTYAVDVRGLSSSAPGAPLTLGDPTVAITGPGGVVVATDDNGGTGNDARAVFTAATTGVYNISVGAGTAAGNGLGTYQVVVTQAAAPPPPPPPPPPPATDDFTIAAPGTVAVGATATGNIETAGDSDPFTVALAANTSYVINVQSVAGSTVDPIAALFAPGGAKLAEVNDSNGSNDAQIAFAATTAGTYTIDVKAAAGTTGAYAVQVLAQALPPPPPPPANNPFAGEDQALVTKVAALYFAGLGRAPDTGGLRFWLDEAKLLGGNTAPLIPRMLGTAEGQGIYGPKSNQQDIEFLYNTVLARTSDPGGLQFWTNSYNGGTPLADIINQFTSTAEVTSKASAFVQQLTGASPTSVASFDGLDGLFDADPADDRLPTFADDDEPLIAPPVSPDPFIA